MENRNKYGVNVKIEPLAEKLLAVASAEGATVLDFTLACEKAQRMIGEKEQGLVVKKLLTSNFDESQCDAQCTREEGKDPEKRIEKILEKIVDDLSKDPLDYMELQLKENHINALDMSLQLSRKIRGRADD